MSRLKFLANENFPMPGILLLRNAGYEVISILEEYGGIKDEQVLKLAVENDYIILTFDSDYGTLIFKYNQISPPAVIYFRTKGKSPTWAAEILVDKLNEEIDFVNYFTVIEDNAIRQRKFG